MVYRKVRGPLEGRMISWQFAPDARLLRIAKAAAVPGYEAEPVTANGETYQPTVLPGVVTASDMFGVSDEKIADMREKLDPDIMEMESAAIAQVCVTTKHAAHRLPRGQQPHPVRPRVGLPQARADRRPCCRALDGVLRRLPRRAGHGRSAPEMKLISPGDGEGFVAAFVNNLVQLLILAPLCVGVLGFSPALVYGRILPGVAVSFLVGNMFYAFQALALSRREGTGRRVRPAVRDQHAGDCSRTFFS